MHTPIVVVLNNSGFTIERLIRSPGAPYHDITPWNWTALPSALPPGVPVTALRVTSGGELVEALRVADRVTDRLVLIEALLAPSDAPRLVKELARRAHRPAAAVDQTSVSHLEELPCVSESTFLSPAPAST